MSEKIVQIDEIKEIETKKEESKYDFSEIEKSKWEINCEHLDVKIQELEELMEVTDEYSSMKLLDLFKNLDIKNEDFQMWAGYGESGTVFSGKEDAHSKLSSVVTYAETDENASKNAKHRLRVVTKLFLTDEKHETYNPTQILLLLAAHGNVCNVQKEVAIHSAFSLMTNSMNDLIEKNGIEAALYRVLRDYRYLLVEHLYKSYKATNNIHSIVTVSNALSKKIGIYQIRDPNESEWDLPTDWRSTADKKYFDEFYTVPNIVKHVNAMIKEKKLSYQQIIGKFEQLIQEDAKKDSNIDLKDYTYSFLHNAIDMTSGEFKSEYLCWFLSHCNVLKKQTGECIAELRRKQVEEKK